MDRHLAMELVFALCLWSTAATSRLRVIIFIQLWPPFWVWSLLCCYFRGVTVHNVLRRTLTLSVKSIENVYQFFGRTPTRSESISLFIALYYLRAEVHKLALCLNQHYPCKRQIDVSPRSWVLGTLWVTRWQCLSVSTKANSARMWKNW